MIKSFRNPSHSKEYMLWWRFSSFSCRLEWIIKLEWHKNDAIKQNEKTGVTCLKRQTVAWWEPSGPACVLCCCHPMWTKEGRMWTAITKALVSGFVMAMLPASNQVGKHWYLLRQGCIWDGSDLSCSSGLIRSCCSDHAAHFASRRPAVSSSHPFIVVTMERTAAIQEPVKPSIRTRRQRYVTNWVVFIGTFPDMFLEIACKRNDIFFVMYFKANQTYSQTQQNSSFTLSNWCRIANLCFTQVVCAVWRTSTNIIQPPMSCPHNNQVNTARKCKPTVSLIALYALCNLSALIKYSVTLLFIYWTLKV